jgi:hypothetical protein
MLSLFLLCIISSIHHVNAYIRQPQLLPIRADTSHLKSTGTFSEYRTKSESKIKKLLDSGTNLFPFFVASFSALGARNPQSLSWFQPYVTPALSLTMLSMGMTLTVDDFKRVGRNPKYILLGFVAQYSIMPLTAYYIAKYAQLGPALRYTR